MSRHRVILSAVPVGLTSYESLVRQYGDILYFERLNGELYAVLADAEVPSAALFTSAWDMLTPEEQAAVRAL